MFDGNGDASILRLLGSGAVIGLKTTLDSGEVYHCTATALSRIDVCRIPLQAFQRLMRDHPEHYKVIVRLRKRHLEAADEALLGFRSGELRERLVAIMNTLSRYAGDSKSFTLPSGRDLSALTGGDPGRHQPRHGRFQAPGRFARGRGQGQGQGVSPRRRGMTAWQVVGYFSRRDPSCSCDQPLMPASR
jgi:hypothetical protein